MEVLREIREINDKKIVIDLPDCFMRKQVEIIVLPLIQNLKINKKYQ